MNYLLPERLEALSREYALGTLSGGPRRRFERLMRESISARAAVAAWQHRLSALAMGVPAMQPRAQVWTQIEQRLFAPPDKAEVKAQAPSASQPQRRSPQGPGLGARIGAWLWALLAPRNLGTAFAGALLCAVLLQSNPGLIGMEPASQTLPASYVGLLLNAEGKPTLLAQSRRHGEVMTVKVLRPVALPPGKVLQLWAFPNGKAPFPVAVLPALPAVKESVSFTLPNKSEALFATVERLAISVADAPAQAGDAPPAEFLLSGHCVKLW